MDKIEKILRKMSSSEQEAMILLIYQLKKDHSKIPGIIKLVGKKDLYRVRMGQYRLIFKIAGSDAEIVRISRRNESTYKDLR